jgi:hypothetical protein
MRSPTMCICPAQVIEISTGDELHADAGRGGAPGRDPPLHRGRSGPDVDPALRA